MLLKPIRLTDWGMADLISQNDPARKKIESREKTPSWKIPRKRRKKGSAP